MWCHDQIRHFEHAWLKESWATYMEALWLEDTMGQDEFLYQVIPPTTYRLPHGSQQRGGRAKGGRAGGGSPGLTRQKQGGEGSVLMEGWWWVRSCWWCGHAASINH